MARTANPPRPHAVEARVALRPSTPADRDLLRDVYGSTRTAELALMPWPDEQKRSFVEFQFVAQDRYYREHYDPATFDVIEVDGEPVGRLYVARWPEEIRIVDIALLPAQRGRGVGTRLLRELMREAADAGKCLSIHVEHENPARSLYARLGFVQVEDRGVYQLMKREAGAKPRGGG
jgi:GNAT superfamily N-acetyltransferase